tara:strand:- start:2249 stop:2419 length:171 start_codon:yes stop_codon:yes gene_type:complete
MKCNEAKVQKSDLLLLLALVNQGGLITDCSEYERNAFDRLLESTKAETVKPKYGVE